MINKRKSRGGRELRTCAGCGDIFECYKSDRKIYCSKTCRHKHLHIIRKCKYCGNSFEVLKSSLNTNASGNYCSLDCYYMDGRKQITCINCGLVATVKKHQKHKFCSHKCAMEYLSGIRHYRWLGPENTHTSRGRGWYAIRQRVLNRDKYTCQECGIQVHDNDNKRGCISNVANVHHITPYRLTKDNSLSNLVTLCPSCHMKIEWQPNVIKMLKNNRTAIV